jgi:hypothetical protein
VTCSFEHKDATSPKYIVRVGYGVRERERERERDRDRVDRIDRYRPTTKDSIVIRPESSRDRRCNDRASL